MQVKASWSSNKNVELGPLLCFTVSIISYLSYQLQLKNWAISVSMMRHASIAMRIRSVFRCVIMRSVNALAGITRLAIRNRRDASSVRQVGLEEVVERESYS